MELTKVAGALISLLRMLATGQLIKPITILRCFITSNSITSGNVDYDERELAKFNRFARIIIQSIFFWVFIDTILFPFANSTGYELFRFRLPSSWVGERTSNFLNTFLVGATPVAIIPKIICCTACIGVILTGMRTKLHLLAHRFKKIVQLDPNDEQYFERVVHDLREAVDQHAVYWRLAQFWPVVPFWPICLLISAIWELWSIWWENCFCWYITFRCLPLEEWFSLVTKCSLVSWQLYSQ